VVLAADLAAVDETGREEMISGRGRGGLLRGLDGQEKREAAMGVRNEKD
jgi:hypothetical protein